MSDPFKSFEIIEDRNGDEHKIYSAPLSKLKDIRYLTTKFNDTFLLPNLLAPKFDDEMALVHDKSGEVVYDDKPVDYMLEVAVIALNDKQTKAEIKKWADLATLRKIFEIFYDISQLKKNPQMA